MNIAEPILKLFRKPSVPDVSVGDVVRVHQKIKEGSKERIQVFEGIVIATHNKTNLDSTFTVRKIASGVGVERTYLLHSPRIAKIEFKRSSDVRRAKLYFLRNLTGKALKMKDKKVTKDSWSEVLASETVAEPTEAEIQEAVTAANEQEARAGHDETVPEQVAEVEQTDNSGVASESDAAMAETEKGADVEVDNLVEQVEDSGNDQPVEETEEIAEVVSESDNGTVSDAVEEPKA